ncbi:MAG: fibronectin type III domain-containing protein [Planctomycetes bacterium]|nr:fibronectin type III domain-containing protein [Planctomycetota bacterium]
MAWSHLRLFKDSNRAPRRSPIRRAHLRVDELESRLAPSANVLTFHNDIASTGLNAAETQLTPANVKVNSFGKLSATTLDGQVYAEPLVDTGVTIANGVNTKPGAAGVHDVVFVGTEHDSLYAIDTNAAGGPILWQRTFLDTTNPTGDINNTFGASAIGTIPSGDTGSADISPEIGITGTPVIDPATNIMYVVVKTKETIGGTSHYIQRLHAINISDGTDAATPTVIGDTTGTNTNSTSIYVYGSGDGNVTDPYNGTGKKVVQFNALREHQRGALSLVNNQVYIEWASHGDNGPYHGWVVVWNVANVKTSGFQMTGVLNTSPNNGLSGIWQGGGRLAFEANGSAFYFETGNGSGGAPTLNASGFPTNANYNEALVKVIADPTTTPTNQNPNGWGLKVSDYFIPFNVNALDGADSDFGSGAPLLLPDSAGLPGHPHLMVAAGKEGKIYLVDRDNMGHFDPNNDHVVNAAPDGSGHNTATVQISGSLSTAAFFNGTIYWVSGYSGTTNAYTISSSGLLNRTSQTAVGNFGYLPGSVVVSANGTTNGIVWVMDRNSNQIHAYDATSLSTELWNSGQKTGGVDNLGAVVKLAAPTVANGKVFVGTTNSLVIYGQAAPATAVPSAPVLSATVLSGSSINLTWTDSTQPPNTANGYKIEQSTDNVNFTQVTTAPPGATSIAVGGLAPLTKYYFRIRGFNGIGNSNYSNTASATTTNQVALLDFSGGFAGSTSKLTYNGSAAINGPMAELTNSGGNQAGSFFSTSPVDITKFNSQFTFQISAGASTADGLTFTIQGIGPTALGPTGGGLGYGPDHVGGTGGITNSVAIKFDLYSNEGEGVDSTGLYTGGAAPTSVGSIDLTPSSLDLHSGDTFQVNLTYDGTTLFVTIKDTITNASVTQNYTIDIPTTVATGAAYVGFTGGTGGLVANQDILAWTFSPNASASPNAPSGLGATAASATSVNLNWTNTATNQTGFHLDRATDPGFTANLITENLPASPNTFTDTATGLAPGSTFYYRLRAFNSAGDSGNSNVASVTIPLAPPKPTNQVVTDVTTSEIDMSWQDNAGHAADGYKILRAINHGSFTQVATLPPTSRTPPSTYEWADTNLSPGTYYEYHIVAYNVAGNNDFAGFNATTLTLAPSGVSATAGNAVVTLSWSAPTGAQTYNVYRGTTPGGESATAFATGITATMFVDSAVTNGTTYFYTVTAVNANTSIVPAIPSESAPSVEVSATPNVATASLEFSGGFAGSTNTLTYNGSAAINGSMAELTNNGGGQAGSFFSTSPVDVTNFNSQFTFQISAGASTADGLTFTIQGIGPTALGPSGGGLGYGPDHVGGTGGIGNSVAIKFDLYSNEGEGVDSTGLYTSGAAPTNVGSIDLTPSSLDLHSGDTFQVNLTYDGTTLMVTIKDTVTGASATQNYTINIPATVGSSTAYVGFTGGTGGLVATQDILTWTFAPNAPATAPSAPSGLGAAAASANSVTLNWTNNAANQTGFHLDRATNAGFTANLITENLPASPNTFTDTAAGLAAGSTFYYRLRAFNSAGDSGDSNVASVTIPLAPPAPTSQKATNVTTTEIDMSWQDNAGNQAGGYRILRAVNHGSFSPTATLPPASQTPPSTYTWADTNLSPGTFYEYQIVAYNVSGNSSIAAVNATTLTLAPSGVSATPGNAVVTLTWTAPTGAQTYNVYRGTTAGGEGATPLATGITATTFVDTAVTNGTTYFYQVTAVNANASIVPAIPSESARSVEVSAKPQNATPPPAPTNLTATGTPANQAAAQVTLMWASSTGAASYKVYRSLTSNGEGGTALAAGITAATFTDTSVAFGTPYFYKVTAVSAGGESGMSNEVSIKPYFITHVNFTSNSAETPTGYISDTGLAYGSRVNGLSFGWNQDNSANARDRDSSRSPDELHDSLVHMQKSNNPNGSWKIAVPNGTYTVHMIAGDSDHIDSVYRINVQGVLAISGNPTSANRWFENTISVTVTNGFLNVTNATGSSNNKIDAIDITQTGTGGAAGATRRTSVAGFSATAPSSTLTRWPAASLRRNLDGAHGSYQVAQYSLPTRSAWWRWYTAAASGE